MSLFHRKKVNNEVTDIVTADTISYSFKDFQAMLAASSKYKGMKISAVNKCVELISDTVAKIPFFIYNEKTSEYADMDNASVGKIVGLLETRPNRNYTKSQFYKLLTKKFLLEGQIFLKLQSGKMLHKLVKLALITVL